MRTPRPVPQGKTSIVAVLASMLLSGYLMGGCQSLELRVEPTTVWLRHEPGAPQDQPARIRMQACRNGHDGFQLAVVGRGKGIRNVNARLQGPLRSKDAKLPASNLELFRELNICITTATSMHPERYPEGEWPDPLLPFFDPYRADHPPLGAPFDISRVGPVGKSYLAVGDGACFSGGFYDGDEDRGYVVEIDGEGELGQATFRWSDAWDGKLGSVPYQYYATEPAVTAWSQERIPCTELPTALSHGVTVRFTGGQQIVGKTRLTYKNATDRNFKVGDRYYFRVYREAQQVIYGDLYVPTDAAPGEYTGSLIVTADGYEPREIPIDLTVYNIALPHARTIETAFGRMPSAECYHHGDAERMKSISKNYEEMLQPPPDRRRDV